MLMLLFIQLLYKIQQMKIKLLIILLHLCILITPFIRVKDNKLYDEQGRQRIFHGMNAVVKTPPYIPQLHNFNIHNSLCEKDMQYLKSWGMNIIRLGVMWPGVQPKENQINSTYLQAMNQLVQNLGKYGIYTLVQYHQDLFSQKFCGDGVPIWAIKKSIYEGFPLPLKKPTKWSDSGYPTGNSCSSKYGWGSYYSTFSVNLGFSALYLNKNGLLDKFTNYWGNVSETFSENQYVLAFQLMNQPWPGNMYNDPFMMIPHVSQVINLQRVYDHLSLRVRQKAPNHNICFEPVTWLNTISAGFTHPPGGDRYANQSIFCYHYYNPPTIKTQGFMDQRMSDIKRLNTGGLLSEFYIIGDQGKRNVNVMQICDQYQQSWIGWIYKSFYFPGNQQKLDQRSKQQNKNKTDSDSWFFDHNENVIEQAVRLVARTYAPAVAGQSLHQAFDNNTQQYTLSYNICVSCGDTIIFANREIIYKNGYSLNIYPKMNIDSEQFQPNYIRLRPNKNTIDGQRILVVIIPL